MKGNLKHTLFLCLFSVAVSGTLSTVSLAAAANVQSKLIRRNAIIAALDKAANTLTLTIADEQFHLRLNAKAAITQDGEPFPFDRITVGQRIRVFIAVSATGEYEIASIDVLKPKAASPEGERVPQPGLGGGKVPVSPFN